MTSDRQKIMRLKFALAKVRVAQRILREAQDELRQAVVEATQASEPPPDRPRLVHTQTVGEGA